MSELSPWPLRDGFVHHEALFSQAVQIQVDQSGPIVPLSPRDLAEFVDRDVSAAVDEPIAEIYTEPSDRTVTMLLDEKTAAVLIYAARLLAANCEGHAREVLLVAEQLPEGSYGHANRIEIASRQERIANRIRLLERAYRDVIEKEYYGI